MAGTEVHQAVREIRVEVAVEAAATLPQPDLALAGKETMAGLAVPNMVAAGEALAALGQVALVVVPVGLACQAVSLELQ